MYQSVWLLAATFAVGAPGDAPPCPTCETSTTVNQQVNNAPQAAVPREKRIGFFGRLANRFNPHRTTTPIAAASAPDTILAPTPVEQPVQTVGAIASTDGIVLVDFKQQMVVKKELFDKIGHADDYAWVTGQLFYVHAGGEGIWVLRYSGVDEEDRYGGSVVLTSAVSMRNFREGDLVSVTGEVLKDGRASKHLGGPLYRATSINMVERSDP